MALTTMNEGSDLIPVQIKRVGTVYIKSNPRLKRLRAQIGRFVGQKKRAEKLYAKERITEGDRNQQIDSAKERLRSLYAEFEEATRFAVEKQLRDMTRFSAKTYSKALFQSGSSGGQPGHSVPGGLPSLGKKR
jgi:hypothetical protein